MWCLQPALRKLVRTASPPDLYFAAVWAAMKQWIQKLLGPTRAGCDQEALLPGETGIYRLAHEQKYRWTWV